MGIIKIILHILAALIAAVLAAAYFMYFDYENSYFDPTSGKEHPKRYTNLARGGLTTGCKFNDEVGSEKYYRWICPTSIISKDGLSFPSSSFLYAQLSASFIAGILGIVLIIIEILCLFMDQIRDIVHNGILTGIIFIVLGIPALGVSLDLGIAAGILGMVIGIIEILFGAIPSLKSLLN
jgi:hypothetical protein